MINSKFTVTGQCLATQFSRGADAWSRRLSWPGGQQHRRVTKKGKVSNLKIPTTDLPFPSYSRHTSPWQCDTWLRTPPSPISVCPRNVRDTRYRFLDSFNWAKEWPQFLNFNRTYHFITRCFGPLDIQLPLVRMRHKNCATVRGHWIQGKCSSVSL